MTLKKVFALLLVAVTIITLQLVPPFLGNESIDKGSFLYRASAQAPLALSISLDQPYYTSKNMFTTKISLSNSSPQPFKKAKIVLTVNKGLLSQNQREATKKTKIVFRKIWWRTLPAGTTTLKLKKKIPSLGLRKGVYPLTITISKFGKTHLEEKTSLVVVDPQPLPPLLVALVWNIDDQVHFNPERKFTDQQVLSNLSDDPLNPGFYSQPLVALSKHPSIKVSLNFTPLLLEEILNIENGYVGGVKKPRKKADSPSKEQISAQKVRKEYTNFLKKGQIELIPAPYAYSSLPFLASKNWGKDALSHMDKGREVVAKVFDDLAKPKGIYLPGLKLDSKSLGYLGKTKTSYTVVDDGYFPKKLKKDIYQPYEVKDTEGRRVTLFYRDGFASRELTSHKDPEIVAQNFIGNLARTYLTSPPSGRVAIIAPEERVDLSLLEPIYEKLEKVSWIKTVSLAEAKQMLAPLETAFVPQKTEDYEGGRYDRMLSKAREDFYLFSEAVKDAHPLKEELLKNLLIAESNHFTRGDKSTSANLGTSFLEDLQERIESQWKKITLVENESVTLPSSRGKIPVAIQNKGDYTLKLSVTLKGRGLSFPSGNTQEVNLKPKENLFTFPVTMKEGVSLLTASLHYRGSVIKKTNFTVKKASSAGQRAVLIAVIFLTSLGAFFVWRYRKKF